MKNLTIIVAMSENNVIGLNGKLPWHMPSDLKRFKNLTINNSVIMGRKTFESIGRILPNRENIILTKQNNFNIYGAKIANNLEDAIKQSSNNVFIIGGEEIYRQTLPIVNKLEITKIHRNYDGNAFFPKINYSEWNLTNKTNYKDYSFLTYTRK